MPTNLSAQEQQELISLLEKRFSKNMKRHPSVAWTTVLARLQQFPSKLASLMAMEETGGEPDVIALDEATGEVVFCDCAAESPKGRRSLCYDREAWEARKEFKPAGNAMDVAAEMGIEMLDEDGYRFLQTLGTFDAKTSSWLKTPEEMRKLGGAIFGDFRFGRVFIYHNGVQSYYGARAFRGTLRV